MVLHIFKDELRALLVRSFGLWVINSFFAVIPLTRVFRERSDICLSIVNKTAAKAMNRSFVFDVEQVPPS